MEGKIKHEFSDEELNAIRKYEEHLSYLISRCQRLLKYPNSRLGSLLDELYDAIGDYFPFDIEL